MSNAILSLDTPNHIFFIHIRYLFHPSPFQDKYFSPPLENNGPPKTLTMDFFYLAATKQLSVERLKVHDWVCSKSKSSMEEGEG